MRTANAIFFEVFYESIPVNSKLFHFGHHFTTVSLKQFPEDTHHFGPR